MNRQITLYIPMDIHSQVMSYVMACDIEISGKGQVLPYKDGFMVTKVYLPKQECTGVTTEIDAASMGKVEYEAVLNEDQGELIWWWHSHVDMETRFSSVDLTTIKGESADGARMIATVFNKSFDMNTAYQQGASTCGNYPPFFMDGVRTLLIPAIEHETEVKNAVRVKQVTVRKPVATKTASTKPFGGSMEGLNKFYAPSTMTSMERALAIEVLISYMAMNISQDIEEMNELIDEYEYDGFSGEFDDAHFKQWLLTNYDTIQGV